MPVELDATRALVVDDDAHEVADGDDPDGDAAAIEHGQVAKAAVDHHRGCLAGRLGGVDRLGVACHPRCDVRALHRSSGDCAEHVTLGEDSRDVVAGEHERGTYGAVVHL